MVDNFPADALRCDTPEAVAVAQAQHTEPAATDTYSVRQHCLEDRLQVARRCGDDLQHLRGGGLLLQRLLRLGDQPRVLDSDDRLRGEILQQRNLLFGEWPYFVAVGGDIAEQLAILAQRHKQLRADASLDSGGGDDIARRDRQGLHIGDLDEPFSGLQSLMYGAGGARSAQHCRERLWHTMRRDGMNKLAVIDC